MRLSDFFELSETAASTHSWVLASHDPASSSPRDALAKALADRIMGHQCRGCPHLYQAWKKRVNGGPPPSGASRKALAEGFVGPVFGVPSDPESVPRDHLEGFVSQLLWYFLYKESPPEQLVRLEPPGFKSTDPGGDSLAIHRSPGGYLMFRLWEMKKYTGDADSPTASVSPTVNDAYTQLNAQALEYLARYTVIGQELPDPELTEFYGKLVEFWIRATKEAAAGVSVVTSICHIPQRCFTTFGMHFPKFVDPVRLRGMLTAIGDFSAFSLRVREHIWTGL